MNIPIIYGTIPGIRPNLDKALQSIKSILEELSVDTPEINLFHLNLPYYDGFVSETIENPMKLIGESKGVILISHSYFGAPNALTQTFLEYFSHPDFKNTLKDKCCLLIAGSDTGHEGEAVYTLEKQFHFYGAFTNSIPLSTQNALMLDTESPEKEAFERYIEDYYRNIRGSRKFFIPKDHQKNTVGGEIPILPEQAVELPLPKKKPTKSIEEINQKLEQMEPHLEKDINEITQFFAQKFKTKTDEPLIESIPLAAEELVEDIVSPPRVKNCRQNTQSLVHYFQPQLAADLDLVVQYNITGVEEFEAYMTIKNNECLFSDGQAKNPDVTIIADSDTWTDILNGKYTAQKAFMIGQLKVRGNFVFLTKFDQIFKIGTII